MSITINGRTAEHPIDPLFLERWSPRALTGEAIPETELLTILEAARWAASSYNAQPWRLLYARRDTPDWARFFGLLNDFNRSWAHGAAAVIIFVSRTVSTAPDGTKTPAPTHAFDTGAASAQMALQATRMGWSAHGLAGFDRDRTRTELNVPAEFSVDAAYVIGRRGDPGLLPEGLRAREAPSGRLPLAEIALPGGFPAA